MPLTESKSVTWIDTSSSSITATDSSYLTSSNIYKSAAGGMLEVNKTDWKDLDYGTSSTIGTLYNDKKINTIISENDYKYNLTKIINDDLTGYGTHTLTVGYGSWGVPLPPVLTPSERMRQIIAERSAPAMHVRGDKRRALTMDIDIREQRARATLRRIVGEDKFKRFMRDGFLTVVSKTGLTYRIYPGHGISEVYDRGVMVERLCVVLQGGFTPTDSLLMRYLLILNDEGEFSKYAIKHGVYETAKNLTFTPKVVRPLVEVWAGLKVA